MQNSAAVNSQPTLIDRLLRGLVLASALAANSAYAEEPATPATPPGVPTEDLSGPEPATDEKPDDKPAETQPPEPPKPEPAKPTESDEPTAADADGAPLPGHESGRTDRIEGDSTLRNIGQGFLVIPKVVLVTALAPIRTTVWMYDRYQFGDRFNTAFFDDTVTYGVYPTLSVDSTYGLNVGARLVHRNLLGKREKISLRGTTGGQFRTLVDARLRSGTRLGERTTLELRAEYERRPREPYYGVGNVTHAPQSRFRTVLQRATAYLDTKVADRLVLRTTGAMTDRNYEASDSSEGTPVDALYDTTMLTGFGGTRNMYGELELRLDRRGREDTPGRHRIYDTGYLLAAFAGRVHQMESGPMAKDYWRYGGEAQHFLGIGVGPRSLMTKIHVESVTGDLNDVVFNQLPALGGAALLRGYFSDRFRDRASVVGTAEYTWGLGQLFLASVFVDAGRVYPSLKDFTVRDLRVGYGASLQFHGNRQFISGLTVSSSLDGGVLFNLTFDPVFDFDPRAERR